MRCSSSSGHGIHLAALDPLAQGNNACLGRFYHLALHMAGYAIIMVSMDKRAARIAKLVALASCPNASPGERSNANARLAELGITPLTVGARVRSMWGVGVVTYMRDDGWVGVRLDGERRVDEYPIEHVYAA